ncbi:ammonium transporter Rh type A-like [Paramacrobiotus metropolitanus]|uniref:ammonium transporter Rh type A-like n=1 Tax=Paramacrobiotus metropolitanus TaxID=2943436 RepID=UPI002445B602|nr:ammonium transporter Rh type A-like [Paramacrobiotus metropolitanus]
MSMYFTSSRFAAFLFLSQAGFIILFGFLVDYGWDATPVSLRERQMGDLVQDDVDAGRNVDFSAPRKSLERYYGMFQDVHVMIFVGFGFLVAFMRNYGYSGVGFTFILAAYVLQWALLMRGLLRLQDNRNRIRLDVENLLDADFTAGTILITFGVILGKLNRLQYLITIFMEVVFVTVNEWICMDLFNANDVGGTITIHLFGAYFGLAMAKTLHLDEYSDSKFNTLKFGTHYNDLLTMIGTLFLWMFWPSFNAAPAVGDGRYRAVMNTYLSVSASCIGAFMISAVTSNKRFRMDIIQNATLAGGVVIGSACDMYLYGWGALIVGFCAGCISALGFHFIMKRNLGIHDTCGVHNLHAMPSFFGTIMSAIVIGCATPDVYGSSFYTMFPTTAPRANTTELAQLQSIYPDVRPGLGRTIGQQAGYQMAAMATTLGIAISGGIVTGLVLRLAWWKGLSAGSSYNDSHHWEVPEEVTHDEIHTLRHRLDKKAPSVRISIVISARWRKPPVRRRLR